MPSYRVNQPPDGPAAIFHCPWCNAEQSLSSSHASRHYCNNCSESWFTCNPRSRHGLDTVPMRFDGGIVSNYCRACAITNNVRCCLQCFHYDAEYSYMGDLAFCRDCAVNYMNCPDCGSTTRVDNAVLYGSTNYCGECASYRMSVGGCGCVSCRSSRERARDRDFRAEVQYRSDPAHLWEYNYRPELNFHGKGPLFLGMELELETGTANYDSCLEVVREHLKDKPNLAFLKSDGSIQFGFELVTHPMTYEWAMENFPWEMITELEQNGANTHSRVGMHVHLSRKGFVSPTHIYKWMKFIYRNSQQVTRLARRESYDWAAFDPDDRANIKHYCKGLRGDARYRAINTQNSDTFEFRVFRSSTKPQEIQAALALSDGSVQYAGSLTASDIMHGGWEWPNFHEWISHRTNYQPLMNEMEVQGCVS